MLNCRCKYKLYNYNIECQKYKQNQKLNFGPDGTPYYPGVLSGFEVEFADEGCYTISAVFKIWKTFVLKEIRQPNGAETF